jgi:hypothetical protein
LEKQKQVNDHYNIAEFIEELMEEERKVIQKEEKKII